ncbi:MAG: TPM domain-containing protein [Burkholderiales bacterium]|nr:TPM domain-containing protein [Burkholderiales bacterium]
MTSRLTRIARHWWHDERHLRRTLDPAALARLQARVTASEARHSGEIRVCVEAALPLRELWRDAGPRQRALALFGELGVWNTEANNGVLIYLLLAERAIEIVADRGVAHRVPPGHWAEVLAGMREAFKAGRFEPGLLRAIDAVDAVLVQHFPLAPGQANPNELPDGVALR